MADNKQQDGISSDINTAPPAQTNPLGRSAWIWVVSLLGAAGTGLQNYVAFFNFLASITHFSWEVVQGLAISLGGFCSGIVNHCINVDLLTAFMERIYPLTEMGKKKQLERKRHHVEILTDGRTRFQYWGGSLVFIITGILFGLTALSFGSVSMLTALAIAAGVFVSIIMIIQELETWLSAFDPLGCNLYVMSTLPAKWDPQYHKSFVVVQDASDDLKLYSIPASGEPQLVKKKDDFAAKFKEIVGIKESIYLTAKETEQFMESKKLISEPSLQEKLAAWFKNKSWGHWLGTVIAIGNVLALSLLFTAGLTGFLITVGTPPFTALITGLCIAFTIGAFTEFYFYNFFLATFCANIDKRWQALLHSEYCVFGIFTILVNGLVNGALCYSGVLLLNPLFIAAGLAAPPLALAIVAAIFGGLASLLLGSDFWIKNWQAIMDAVGQAWDFVFADEDKESMKGIKWAYTSEQGIAIPPVTAPLLPYTSSSQSADEGSVLQPGSSLPSPV